MITAIDVCVKLKCDPDYESEADNILLPYCQMGLDWVNSRLLETADRDDPLVCQTAAAMARYLLFERKIAGEYSLSSYKVGDISVQRDIEKEFAVEDMLLRRYLALAVSILKDGEFYFEIC